MGEYWLAITFSAQSLDDASAGKIVGTHFHNDAISGKHFDVVDTHSAGDMSEDFVSSVDLHAKRRVGERFFHGPGHLHSVFRWQECALGWIKET